MNREIKFRGKRIDNDQWVTGCLVSTSPDEAFILIGVTGHIKRDDYECYMVPVKPETVGQWTGMNDKNNINIYDGDVCRHLTEDDVYQITYADLTASYQRKYIKHFGVEGIDTLRFYNTTASLSIVIGNIHDNPELLTPLEGERINTMTTDPNVKQADEATNEQANAQESAQQEQAMGATDSEEVTEG